MIALTHGVLRADSHKSAAQTLIAATLARRLDPHLVSRIGRALDDLDLGDAHALFDAMPDAPHWEPRLALLLELPTVLARPADVLRFLQGRAARVTHGADLYWLHRVAVWFGAGAWGPASREARGRVAEWASGFWASHRPEQRQRVLAELRWVGLREGAFRMGSPDGMGDAVERPQHAVEVVAEFDLLDTQVTHAQYERFDPAHRSDRQTGWTDHPDDHPVYNVTWYEAAAFAQWLDAAEPERRVRLPFEVEWEYATRLALRELPAEDTGVLAWFDGNASGRTHPVRRKADTGGRVPGGRPLWDLLGNVWQLCADRWDARRYRAQAASPPFRHDPRVAWVEHPTADPKTRGVWRVGRGGCWSDPAVHVRVAFRVGVIQASAIWAGASAWSASWPPQPRPSTVDHRPLNNRAKVGTPGGLSDGSRSRARSVGTRCRLRCLPWSSRFRGRPGGRVVPGRKVVRRGCSVPRPPGNAVAWRDRDRARGRRGSGRQRSVRHRPKCCSAPLRVA